MNQGLFGFPMPKVRLAVMNQLAADVTMTTGSTFFDGPAVSLIPGTWLLIGKVTCRPTVAGSTTYTSKLWDGTATDTPDSTEVVSGGTSFLAEMTNTRVVTCATTTTYKISVSGPAGAIKASTTNNVTVGASTLVAVPIG